MAGKTKAQRCEEAAIEEFKAALKQLPDPRRKQGQRYPLEGIVLIALMAMVCGCDDAEAMELWGRTHRTWLGGLVRLPYGPPTQDVFLSVFAALDPTAFSNVFVGWMQLIVTRLELLSKHIAIDGKTSRRSYDRDAYGNKMPALHVVSAWLSEAGLVLGQTKTAEKSNEITAIPELLALIDIRGATVTLDAMGCQKEIAELIVRKGGNYLIAVKENQPTLYADLEATFCDGLDAAPRPLDHPAPLLLEQSTTHDKGHGRVETRTVHVCRDLRFLSTADTWCGLSYVAMVESTRRDVLANTTSTERRYYIGSEAQVSLGRVGALIRRHWGIENEVHWVLDMAFREDEARHRAKNCGANFSTLRHFALNLLKQDKTKKVGIANKRKTAGWDRQYLLQVMTGAVA